MAFYGGLVVYLGQKALEYRQIIIQNLQYTNDAVQSFSDLTEPSLGAEWTIPMERESNARDIMTLESWIASPVEILDPIASNIVGNCSQALEQDQEVMDWLVGTMNITHFAAHYFFVRWSLHDLVYQLYLQFPPPPANYTFWEVECFVRSDFPLSKEIFLEWAQRYNMYFQGFSKIQSQISSELQVVSEVYADQAKLASQRLEEEIRENRTGGWYASYLEEEIPYYTEMSGYYMTLFDRLRDIETCADATTNAIHKHDQFFDLAFHSIFYPVVFMAVTGVVLPLAMLGIGDYLDSWRPWMANLRRALTAVCIIVFVVILWMVLEALWRQIGTLYMT